MLLDFSIRVYLNAQDNSNFYGIYFYGSYTPYDESIINTALVNTVNTYKGNSLELLDNIVMA